VSVTAAQVNELRKATGAGLMDCKKALTETGGDMEKSIDYLRKKGLAAAIFYFPGYAKYQEVKEEDVGKAIAPWEVPTYLLGSCANVEEAVQAVRNVRVGEVVQKEMGYVPPCHYIVNDASGRCVVLEYVGGELKIHDNPLGVITNSPTFDWHVTNLRNYVNLTVNNVPPVDIAGIDLHGFGQGSGMLGLPGDFTPPSRFIRAVAFSQSALPVATAHEGVDPNNRARTCPRANGAVFLRRVPVRGQRTLRTFLAGATSRCALRLGGRANDEYQR